MALTNLNALGSAIRTKVGEAEKKTLPQLKDIVDNQLAYPQGELSVTANGNYDVTSYATARVNIPNLVEEQLVDYLSTRTTFSYEENYLLRAMQYPVYINTQNVEVFNQSFYQSIAKEIKINFSSAVSLNILFSRRNLNCVKLTIVGSTRNVTNWKESFAYAPNLTVIDGDALDFSSATESTLNNTFYQDVALKEVRVIEESIHGSINFSDCENLSKESVLSILKGLSNVGTQKTVSFSSSLNYDSTDEDVKMAISNAIAKNWIVQFGSRTPTGA